MRSCGDVMKRSPGFSGFGRFSRFAIVAALMLVFRGGLDAAVPPVRTMYNDALAREQAVRTALAVANPAPTVQADARQVIARYEALVRHYPASGYSDNALWQAGRLALDLFVAFNQAADRDAAARLFRRLVEGYPASKLGAQVPEQLARLAGTPRRDLVAAQRAGAEQAPPLRSAANARAKTSASVGAELARPPKGIATIKDIRRTVMPEAIRVVIEIDGEVPFRDERIADPSRVFVDLPGTRPAAQLLDQTIRYEGDSDLVRQVRIGRHPNNTTRVVLDTTGVSSYSVYPLYDPYRLVIDCVRESAAVAEQAPPLRSGNATPTGQRPATSNQQPQTVGAELARPPAPRTPLPPREPPPLPIRQTSAGWSRHTPTNTPQHGVLLAEAHAALNAEARTQNVEARAQTAEPPAPIPAVDPLVLRATAAEGAPSDATAPPVRNSNGGFSIARQLGLGVSRIVIDAGHGGHDPGAQARGVVEAELVLDVALRLEKLLQKVQGVDVILTRRTDDFIALQERTAIANRENADLFLSIHANANTSALAHGVETYFLNFASNLSAASVAARENAASGQAMGALPDIVKAIALNNKLDESRDFATQVQHAMVQGLRGTNKTLKDLGVKQAPFVVLIGAAMPSVLAEISFVTNPQEAKLLKNNAYRQRIAEALFDAIRRYQTSLRGLTAVTMPQ
jgi:N-acetylmuramoyl-L-alanine amidase